MKCYIGDDTQQILGDNQISLAKSNDFSKFPKKVKFILSNFCHNNVEGMPRYLKRFGAESFITYDKI